MTDGSKILQSALNGHHLIRDRTCEQEHLVRVLWRRASRALRAFPEDNGSRLTPRCGTCRSGRTRCTGWRGRTARLCAEGCRRASDSESSAAASDLSAKAKFESAVSAVPTAASGGGWVARRRQTQSSMGRARSSCWAERGKRQRCCRAGRLPARSSLALPANARRRGPDKQPGEPSRLRECIQR